MLSDQVAKDAQGQALGCYQAVQAAAMGISPLSVGFAVGTYPELAAWGGAAAMAIAILAMWRQGHRRAQLNTFIGPNV